MRAAGLLTGLVALMLLAGCGFHLRRAPDLPPQMRSIYLAVPGGNSDLLRELNRGLASADTQVLQDPTAARTILSIINVQRSSRPLALNRRGQALEYQVIYEVGFALTVDGVTVIEPQTVTLTRNYAYSASNAIGNEEQEAALNQVMAKDISQFIIFRLVAAAKTVVPAPTTRSAPAVGTRAVPANVPPEATLTAPAAATAAPPV